MAQESKHFGFSVAMFAVVGALVFVVLKLVTPGTEVAADQDMSAAAIEARIAPVGQVNTGAPTQAAVSAPAAAPAAKAAPRSGEEVFKSVCFACHVTGAGGAPKVGDKAAWAPRIKQGIDVLLQHAESGFTGKSGTMPPRGTCANCSNEELKNTIEYMLSQSK